MTKARPQPATAPVIIPSAWPDTMDLETAASYLKLGRDATRALYETGRLAATSLNQKHLVFRRQTLDAFLLQTEREQQMEKLKAAKQKAATELSPRRRPRMQHPDLSQYESDA